MNKHPEFLVRRIAEVLRDDLLRACETSKELLDSRLDLADISEEEKAHLLRLNELIKRAQ